MKSHVYDFKAVDVEGREQHGSLRLLVRKTAAPRCSAHPEFAGGHEDHVIRFSGSEGHSSWACGQTTEEENACYEAGQRHRLWIPQARATPSR